MLLQNFVCLVPESKRSISCFMPLAGIDAGLDYSTNLCVGSKEDLGRGGSALSITRLG